MEGKLKSVKVVFRDGVFIPLEDFNLPNGVEGIVVFQDFSDSFAALPSWWNDVDGSEDFKKALKEFVDSVSNFVFPEDIKLISRDGEKEVIVIVSDESENALRPLMELGYRIYKDMGVFIPIQVITKKRLEKWRDFDREIFSLIDNGISLLGG